MENNSNITSAPAPLTADQQRDALCDVVASLVRAQVSPHNVTYFWGMVSTSLLSDYGITMGASAAQHAYNRHRDWAIANRNGVDERAYITSVLAARAHERETAVYPPSMPIPLPSPPAAPSRLASMALAAGEAQGEQGRQMQVTLGRSRPVEANQSTTTASSSSTNTFE
ncbi:hypothetical protein PRZ48_007713 [Zasmidium cellare]|uniref:Uncharacterized protein n=1 Tax=Zasmidium cellare TaxID=395010 RepID=A0ABR0EK16_ZASCE|nr:hypothetical protein PRZ48_007713 [Zasmidium cellare]